MLSGKATTVKALKDLLLTLGLEPTSCQDSKPEVHCSTFKVKNNGAISTIRLYQNPGEGYGTVKIRKSMNGSSEIEF